MNQGSSRIAMADIDKAQINGIVWENNDDFHQNKCNLQFALIYINLKKKVFIKLQCTNVSC